MMSRLLAAILAALLIAPAAATDAELAKLARASGTPDIPGLKIVWLAPWGDVRSAHSWRNIIVHQTEGPAGSARGGAAEQSKNPTRRGVTVWVETDGTVYWAVAENLVPTHGDGANRNDNKYIDNRPTYRQVVRDNSIGVESPAIIPMLRPVPPRRRSRRGRSSSRCCVRATTSRSTASMRTIGSTTRTRAIAKAAGSRRWRGHGGSSSRVIPGPRPGMTGEATPAAPSSRTAAGSNPAAAAIPAARPLRARV